jgi:hypothetical protein
MNWYKTAKAHEDLSLEELNEIVKPKWINIDSSFIDQVAYSEAARIFEVKLKNGQVYTYKGIPRKVWKDFMKSESKGKFFNAIIKQRYDLAEDKIQ